jgi:hypothetical protein
MHADTNAQHQGEFREPLALWKFAVWVALSALGWIVIGAVAALIYVTVAA